MSQEIDYQHAFQSLTTTVNIETIEGAQRTEESLSSACIYMVPEKLRKHKESAYTPNLVSIGPLHSKDKHLESRMHNIKMSYVNSLLCRMTNGSEERRLVVLDECVEAMKLLVEDAKKCYIEEVDNLNEEMLIVDGCFILELLYKHYLLTYSNETTNEESKEIRDPVFKSNLMSLTIKQDLLLFENQLPFCVLEKLFDITVNKISDHPPISLIDYVISYFKNMMSLTGQSPAGNLIKKRKEVYYHILHIIHDHCLPLDPPKEGDYNEIMPSASYLDCAGVKFVASTKQPLPTVKFTDAQSFLGRCFHRARFEIPTLCLFDSTECYLRNFIAFEQCCPDILCYFTSYAIFMDMLVNSAKDVEVLRKGGIIQNYLGSNQEASNLFNNLCKEVAGDNIFFGDMCNQATKYSKRYWPKTVAHVRCKYFSKPWTVVAFCIAFILIAMTIIQFVRRFFK